MAFLKKAKAVVIHPRVSFGSWSGMRKVASKGATSKDLTAQAREILENSLNSENYLLTHCTIVASVDVEAARGMKTGLVKSGSKSINRKYLDFLIKPQCSQFVNNNGDSWSREVLKLAYPTFIGGFNFQEHVQIEEQSKGRIIDAVARDIGDSLYVDILVATDRKHTALVSDIESGRLTTLSMGCTTDFTICSQCGHCAVDETELCDHIKYSKLNTFIDDQGVKRVVAELCGHHTYDSNPEAPGGVRFIEASWVEVPAFRGAVMREILTAGSANDEKLKRAYSAPVPHWTDFSVMKAASLEVNDERVKTSFDLPEPGGEEPATEVAPEAPPAPFKDLEDSLYDMMKEKVRKRIESEIDSANSSLVDSAMAPNENVIKEAKDRMLYLKSLDTVVRVASDERALLEGVTKTNENFGVSIPKRLYRLASNLGPFSRYDSFRSYEVACRKLHPSVTTAELRVVVRLGTLLSHWERVNNPKKLSRSSTPC